MDFSDVFKDGASISLSPLPSNENRNPNNTLRHFSDDKLRDLDGCEIQDSAAFLNKTLEVSSFFILFSSDLSS